VTRPLISIITPCLNRADFIREAVESVLAQNYPAFEHIIMDGGSTDGTLDILTAYPHLHVVSEPDQGMYDAINKGLRLARGEIIGLLNTDDLYAAGCFDAVASAFEENPDTLAVVGGVTIFTDDLDGHVPVNSFPPIAANELWYRVIQGSPVTNAWFYRPSIFERAGSFDTRFRYSADRFFLIHITLDNNIRPVAIAQVLYQYRQHSGSATITTLDSRSIEYGSTRMKVLGEELNGLEELLNRVGLPDEVNWRLRRAHGECCYRLSATAFYHHKWRLAASTIIKGWQRDVFWPLLGIKMAFERLIQEMNAHG
jgi:glycosyltransferase involved in cell wall biosynthesis